MKKPEGTLRKILGVMMASVASLLLSGIGFLSPLQATTVVPLSFDELVDTSEAIIVGKCAASRAAWDERTKIIWTHTTIEITQAYKGQLSGKTTLVVSEPGGVVGDQGVYVPDAPQFAPGEEVVAFLYRTPLGFVRVRGWGQGKLTIQEDPVSKEKYVKSKLEGLHLVESLGKAQDQQTLMAAGGTDKLPLHVFVRKIQDTLAKANKRGK